jgi:hypothetical protein
VIIATSTRCSLLPAGANVLRASVRHTDASADVSARPSCRSQSFTPPACTGSAADAMVGSRVQSPFDANRTRKLDHASTDIGYAQLGAGHGLRRAWTAAGLSALCPTSLSPDVVRGVAELNPATFLVVVIGETHGSSLIWATQDACTRTTSGRLSRCVPLPPSARPLADSRRLRWRSSAPSPWRAAPVGIQAILVSPLTSRKRSQECCHKAGGLRYRRQQKEPGTRERAAANDQAELARHPFVSRAA